MTVTPDPRLSTWAGGPVGRRDAARIGTAAGSADALGWARATFEGAGPWRGVLVVGWALLLLTGRPTSDATHVLGWPITRTAPDTVVLQRRSRFGILATLLVATGPGTVTFSSAMVFTHRGARLLWAVVAPLHRWLVRVLLRHAARVAI